MAKESGRTWESVRQKYLDAYNVGSAVLALEDTSLAATPELEPIISRGGRLK